MKIYLIILTIVSTLLGAFSLIPAMMSPMMFDTSEALENPATIALFFAITTCPFVCLGSILVAWLLFIRNRIKLARLVILLPAINIVVAAMALGYIVFFCGGSLGG